MRSARPAAPAGSRKKYQAANPPTTTAVMPGPVPPMSAARITTGNNAANGDNPSTNEPSASRAAMATATPATAKPYAPSEYRRGRRLLITASLAMTCRPLAGPVPAGDEPAARRNTYYPRVFPRAVRPCTAAETRKRAYRSVEPKRESECLHTASVLTQMGECRVPAKGTAVTFFLPAYPRICPA